LLAGKRLVRAMQCMQFRARSAKNDLQPMDFLKRNFLFETEGVVNIHVHIKSVLIVICFLHESYETGQFARDLTVGDGLVVLKTDIFVR
jgi:hypothetical protein